MQLFSRSDLTYLGCARIPTTTLPLEGYPAWQMSPQGLGIGMFAHVKPTNTFYVCGPSRNSPTQSPAKVRTAVAEITKPNFVIPSAANRSARSTSGIPQATYISTQFRDIAASYYPDVSGFTEQPGEIRVVWSADFNIPGTPRWVIVMNNYPFYSSNNSVQFHPIGYCELLNVSNLSPQGPWNVGGVDADVTSFALAPIPPGLRPLIGNHQFFCGMIPRTSNPKENMSPLPTGLFSFPSTLPAVRTALPWMRGAYYPSGTGSVPAPQAPETPNYSDYTHYVFGDGRTYHNPFGRNTARTVGTAFLPYGPFGNAHQNGSGQDLKWSVEDPQNPGYFIDKYEGQPLGWNQASAFRGTYIYSSTKHAWISCGGLCTSSWYGVARETIPGWILGDAGATDCASAKGYQGGRFDKVALLFDPNEFHQVSLGLKATNAVRHYSSWEPSDWIFPTCSGFISGMDFDETNMILYIMQSGAFLPSAVAPGGEHALHAFSVAGEPFSGTVTPPSGGLTGKAVKWVRK